MSALSFKVKARNLMVACVSATAMLAMAGSAQAQQASDVAAKGGQTVKISSSAFAEGQRIPKQYTGDGKNVSPPLSWNGAPANTKSFVLICDDPDAPMGTWVHWVVYDIPPSTHSLPEAVPSQNSLKDGAKQGTTSFHSVGYGGPAPPPGKVHRYFFKIYALDNALNLDSGATKDKVEAAMKGHVVAEGQTMGTYSR